MAAPISGAWARANTVPYAGERVWGTGYNPVHEQYGEGWPLRVGGRNEGYPGEQPPSSNPDRIRTHELWGYTLEDSVATGVFLDGRPPWGEDTEQFRADTDDHPPVGMRNSRRFLATPDGAHRYRQKLVNALPDLTVTSGWRNKVQGKIANARVSDPSQYEIQTSMRQRYLSKGNDLAVERATDYARHRIDSRVRGQKLKVYSGEEYHEIMFPYQINEQPRPFWPRIAQTGPETWMPPNEMIAVQPVVREAPPDPYQGTPEADIQEDPNYGYTEEDQFYA